MNIVFMGTPDFAVPCLEALINKGHTVSAVLLSPTVPRAGDTSFVLLPSRNVPKSIKFPCSSPKE